MMLDNQNKLIFKIIIEFVNYKAKMIINNIKLNTYILMKNQQMIIILNNIIISNKIKIYSNMMIYIIEFIIYRYYNKIAKHIKLNLKRIILIDILIKNNNFHIIKI